MSERLKRCGELFSIPFEQIIVDEENNNKRIVYEEIESLSLSIENTGLKVPLMVKKEKDRENFVLLHGHRRFRAIKLAIERGVEFAGIKCQIVPQNYSMDNVLFDMITMNDGKPFSNLEQGLVFTQLKDRGFTETAISEKVGKSISHVRNCIEMAALPKSVQNMIASGTVSGGTAVELSKAVGTEDELVSKLESAIEAAPVASDGKKKKVTKKNVAVIASSSPLKKLEDVRDALKREGISNNMVDVFTKLVSRLKNKAAVENIVELFR